MSNSHDFFSCLAQYHSELKNSNTEKENYSQIWSKLIDDFKSSEVDQKTLEKLCEDSCRGYNFILEKEGFSKYHAQIQKIVGKAQYQLLKYFPPLGHRFRTLVHWAANKMVEMKGISGSYRQFYDYKLYLIHSFLKEINFNTEKKLKSYFPDFKVKQSYNSLKCIYLFEEMIETVKQVNKAYPKSVIEVGAGAGNFPILFGRSTDNFTYYIVDLPEMITITAYEINKFIPDSNIILPNQVQELSDSIDHRGKNFVFLTPEQFEKIPDKGSDLFLNVESFAEMAPSISADYIQGAYRKLKVGGIIYSANRETRSFNRTDKIIHGSSHWKLPFKESDKVVFEKFCPMRDVLTNKLRPNINRLSIVTE